MVRDMTKPPIYLIGGPTASGKTAVALDLARKIGGVIVNADAMQVYRDLPLLTAQPEAADKREIPHCLFEVCDPAEASSAGRWLALARVALEEAKREGLTPIVVGGTGLYFAALEGSLASIPFVPPHVREKSVALYDALGHDAFRNALAEKDGVAAALIASNDRQRLIRAYEVVTHTGRTLDSWQREGKGESLLRAFDVRRKLMMPDRAALYAACDARFLRMMEAGALEEARTLLARVLDPSLPSMKVLGVPELAAHLSGAISLDEAVAKAQQATRNYAKRQITWFRHKFPADDQYM